MGDASLAIIPIGAFVGVACGVYTWSVTLRRSSAFVLGIGKFAVCLTKFVIRPALLVHQLKHLTLLAAEVSLADQSLVAGKLFATESLLVTPTDRLTAEATTLISVARASDIGRFVIGHKPSPRRPPKSAAVSSVGPHD